MQARCREIKAIFPINPGGALCAPLYILGLQIYKKHIIAIIKFRKAAAGYLYGEILREADFDLTGREAV